MRKKLLNEGVEELQYEIRNIVKKAEVLQTHGREIYWENIGDPIQKNCNIPEWMKDIVKDLVDKDTSFGYCHSKGNINTRTFLAEETNKKQGSQITAEDILFFNGLGDAISAFYRYLRPTSRVIGPSPAYSTHSSAEAAHAMAEPLTYKLDPNNKWYPDMEDLKNKVKYNTNIVGIMIINPDNPTGMVYPKEVIEEIVQIAKENHLFIISDEIYTKITYNGARAYALAELIDDVPGIAMRGLSKELPWPGSRCGWLEFYNRDKDPEFNRLCKTLDDAKMIEVCSTTLPQLALPIIMQHPNFEPHRKELNDSIGKRSTKISSILSEVPELIFNPTYGAFYNTIVFKDGVLKPHQSLKIDNPEVQDLVEDWVDGVKLDSRFVYYLLAAKGVCVVPLSSFCSDLLGFRVTLLEENEELLEYTFNQIKEAVVEFVNS